VLPVASMCTRGTIGNDSAPLLAAQARQSLSGGCPSTNRPASSTSALWRSARRFS